VKYCPKYPNHPFESLDKASDLVNEFVDWYNNRHLHSGIKFVTPSDRHTGLDKEILKRRKVVYETAKLNHPNRWSSGTRNWDHTEKVNLNHLQNKREVDIKKAS
jgi:hypothetical protein